ncbi:NADH dehydrogenase [Mesonia hippocampi]|uniref:NADH:ubiquinone reductase (non-electrogenic) n=1 Tax=Mesonia hippocampi TaxID=1628250 RepID=A0A840EPZ5_9FLAO|nr:NAD(P)/FAD-dependent oxidoreductase [Mesonia hippocampi]MBB4119131.1 NADH dehydrogenase [Mesonia hippocampi]
MNIPNTTQPRLVIIGGGFAGMNLAKALVENKNFQVVLIDKHNYHTFQPLLYQVSTAGLEPDSIAYPLRKTIKNGKHIFFRLAEVQHISAERQVISTTIGDLSFDYLVIATGSKTNFFGNKAIEANAVWMKTVPQALNIRSLILQNLEQATITSQPKERAALLRFVIAGGGPTGVELAGAIAELRNNVVERDYPDIKASEISIYLIEGASRVLAAMSEKSSKAASKFLKELGVEILLNTRVEDYNGSLVTTNQADLALETKTFIWSAGVTGAPVEGLQASALIKQANRYKVNVYNQIEPYKNIFALGDIACMQTEALPKGHPMLAQPAIQQAKHLAKNLERLLANKSLLPFAYNDKGTMATVGRNKAVVDRNKKTYTGFFAWFIWMLVHLWFLVGFRNRVITFFNWSYNYINYDKAARLIIRPFKRNLDS